MVINPAFYPVHLNELVAVFTDRHGKVVKAPFPVGSDVTVTVPDGVARLQFGINDDIFADYGGALDVTVSVVPSGQ